MSGFTLNVNDYTKKNPTKVFLSSDHHFEHANIIKYQQRGYIDIKDMEEDLIAKHNSIVSQSDLWICLGDIMFVKRTDNANICVLEKLSSILSKMNGRKILICGNHDNMAVENYLVCGFEKVFAKNEQPVNLICDNRETIRLSHRPPMRMYSDETFEKLKKLPFKAMRLDKFKGDNETICFPCKTKTICGHVHGLFFLYRNGPILNVSVEAVNGYPIELDECLNLIHSACMESGVLQ